MNFNDFSYHDYVTDERFMTGYTEYQKKYASRIRESDRIVLDLVDTLVAQRSLPNELSLLDAGCSTGNLLLHLKHRFPRLSLTGGELVDTVLAQCRENPDLDGISFERMNVVELSSSERFDFIIVNAVLYLFDDDDYDRALAGISRALKPGGSLIAFDFFHPFEQDLAVLEKSETHPDGLMLHFRPYHDVTARLDRQHFHNVNFRPFKIPIDLAVPSNTADMTSYTRYTADGERLLFRGSLFQPWCHLTAQKKS